MKGSRVKHLDQERSKHNPRAPKNEPHKDSRSRKHRKQDAKNAKGTKGTNWKALVISMLLIFAIGWSVWRMFQPQQIDTHEGMELLRGDTIEKVVVNDPAQRVELKLTKNYVHEPVGGKDQKKDHGKQVTFIYSKDQGEQLIKLVEKADPKAGYNVTNPQPSLFGSLLQLMVPIMLLLAGFYWMTARASGGRMMGGFAQSRAKEFNRENPEVTFADVAGEDEAVEELQEIREFLASPQ